MLPARILLAGVPASGKSHFGRWLQQRHAYCHIDAEKGDLERLGLKHYWDLGFSSSGFTTFISHLSDRVVLNWGFPPSCLPQVQSLIACGFWPVWFHVSASESRRLFRLRGEGSEASLEAQLAALEASRSSLERAFSARMIETIDSSGEYHSPERIYELVARTA